MDNKVYKEVSEILEDQMKKIVKKGDISPQELEILYKVSSIVLDFDTRDAMKKAEEDKEYMEKGQSMRGYSQHYPPMYWQSYGNSYDGSYRHEQMSRDNHGDISRDMEHSREHWNNSRDNRSYDYSRNEHSMDGYSGDGSYRRGRDERTGRYVSRDGSYDRDYSRAGEKERMLRKLESMLDDTSNEKEIRAIEQCIERISK